MTGNLRRLLFLLVCTCFHGCLFVNADCVQEFDKCVVQRDCCSGLRCVTGDWQYTTDSTCLSPKSEKLEELKLPLERRIDLVTQFYNNHRGSPKTLEEVTKIVNKYRSEFPKLVAKLEKKYKTEFDIDGDYNEDSNHEL